MKPYLIGIAGPSGAGKSFLADHLVRKLPDAVIVPLDAYYPDLGHLSFEARSAQNFDDPAILDAPLLIEHAESLSRGKQVSQPIYDFAQHTRTSRVRVVHPAQFILFEGIFTFHWPDLRRLMHTRVYVDLDDAASLERRVARDVAERGRTRESVEHQFRSSVVPMAERYVRPTARYADVIVTGSQPIQEAVDAVITHIERMRCH